MTGHDVLSALLSSAIGFVAGYGVGWMGKQAAHIDEPPASPPTNRLFRTLQKWQTYFGLLILAMVVISAVSSFNAASDQRRAAEELQRFTACQTQQNRVFTENIAARSQASKQGNQAMRDFLVAAANPAATQPDKMRALNKYLAALAEVDAIQAAHPLKIAVECE